MWGESIVNGVSLCNDLNIDLDPVAVDQLLYHASFQPQDSQMLSRNKVMIDFGHAVIKLLAGIYFYVDKIHRMYKRVLYTIFQQSVCLVYISV